MTTKLFFGSDKIGSIGVYVTIHTNDQEYYLTPVIKTHGNPGFTIYEQGYFTGYDVSKLVKSMMAAQKWAVTELRKK